MLGNGGQTGGRASVHILFFSGTKPVSALAMEREEGPATATAMEETTGGKSTKLAGVNGGEAPNPYPCRIQQMGEDGTNGCMSFTEREAAAQGIASRPKSKIPSCSKRCGYCNDKLSQDHTKPFCYKCIHTLSGKETFQVMKDFLSVQTEMLTTHKALQETLKPKEPEPLSSREDSSSQEGSSANSDSRHPEPLKALTSQDSKEEARVSDQSLPDEGEYSRPGRHIFF